MLNKKIVKIGIALMIFVLPTFYTGCTWQDFTNKITGQNKKVDNSEPINTPDSAVNNKATLEEQLASQSNIKKFTDEDEFKAFIENGTYGSISSSKLSSFTSSAMESTSTPIAFDAASSVDVVPQAAENIGLGSAAPESTATDYSGTNIQVEGVDEADVIKTDGKNAYAIVHNKVNIIKAYPANEAAILSEIDFDNAVSDLYINDKYLTVFGQDTEFLRSDLYKTFHRHSTFTLVKVYDISDPTKPILYNDLKIEGNYSNSRLIGDYIYLLTNDYRTNNYDDETIMPRVIMDNQVVPQKCDNTKCFNPDIYYFDIPYASYNLTTVYAINIKDKEKNISGQSYLLSRAQDIYVSQNNLYITYTKELNEYQLVMEITKELILPKLSDKQKQKIEGIEKVENYVLNPEEKMEKIMQIMEGYVTSLGEQEQEDLEKQMEEKMQAKYKELQDKLETTVIHKIAINKEKLEYKSSGEVNGSVLNQYSMDEKDNKFRIATTKNRQWLFGEEEAQESYNNLYILDENLKTIGSVEKLAAGESIRSVRFMNNRAYLITFEKTDPLFAIDLSDPTKPIVMGELKMPGYSDYLHPYNDNLIIGLGKDTTLDDYNRVKTLGLKLSLYDVSNITEPKEVDSYIMGDTGSTSLALDDPKAFLFSAEKNLLVIPAVIQEKNNNKTAMSFSGAMVFTVNEQGFELKGKIDHSDNGAASTRSYYHSYSYYDNNVRRSFYIEDNLYTFSNRYLMANNISDFSEVSKVPFKDEIKTEIPDPHILPTID